MSAIQLKLEGVGFNDNSKVIVENVELRLEQGQIVGLIGPSGCGKSTTLNAIAGLGQTDWQGKVTTSGSTNYQLDTQRVSYIFQESRLIPWLTVFQNLTLVMPSCSRAQAESALADVGLDNVMDRYPSQLSGGMQKRVSIARAFVYQPDLLLMDEPFSSLDRPTACELRTLTANLVERCVVRTILVTHDIYEACHLCKQVNFLTPAPASVFYSFTRTQLSSQYMSQQDVDFVNHLLQEHPKLLEGSIN